MSNPLDPVEGPSANPKARFDRDRTESMTDEPRSGEGGRVRSLRSLALIAVAAAIFFCGFVALGIWQLERRVWKLDLIQSVETRVHAAPVPAPGPDRWPAITARQDEYRHIVLTGHFLNDRETFVKAVTDFGGGFWLVTPFVTDRNFTVLVNRGFVSPERRDPGSRPNSQIDGETSVSGLLRITEPGGAFLRSNVPADDRWYSRDVDAIAISRNLQGPVAPYFVDADAGSSDVPIGGLTVISFPNNHLVYALTWFGLALLVAGAAGFVAQDEWRMRQQRESPEE